MKTGEVVNKGAESEKNNAKEEKKEKQVKFNYCNNLWTLSSFSHIFFYFALYLMKIGREELNKATLKDKRISYTVRKGC